MRGYRSSLGILAILVCTLLACGEKGGPAGGDGGSGGTGGVDSGKPCDAICKEGEACTLYGEVAVCECEPANDLCGAGYYCHPLERRCLADGSGGSGGEGGIGGGAGGGAGGSGGENGSSPCDDLSCRPGEACVLAGEQAFCACDPGEDTCAESYFCDSFDMRCWPEARAVEFSECSSPGQVIGELRCAEEYGLWLRPCSSYAECRVQGTYCPRELDSKLPAFCWSMGCGPDDPNIGTLPQNGNLFGPCDPIYHRALDDEAGGGSCQISPGQAAGTCLRSGTSTSSCRDRDASAFREHYACAPGFHCESQADGWGDACASDSDCGQDWLVCDWGGFCRPAPCLDDDACPADTYCSSDKLCHPLGTCTEFCNAGTTGGSAGPYASCGVGTVCNYHPANELPTDSPHLLGICLAP